MDVWNPLVSGSCAGGGTTAAPLPPPASSGSLSLLHWLASKFEPEINWFHIHFHITILINKKLDNVTKYLGFRIKVAAGILSVKCSRNRFLTVSKPSFGMNGPVGGLITRPHIRPACNSAISEDTGVPTGEKVKRLAARLRLMLAIDTRLWAVAIA